MERDAAAILDELGESAEARAWSVAAEARASRVQGAALGRRARPVLRLRLRARDALRRFYPFGAVFFPLWVGLATPAQARRVAAAALPLLLRPGGLATSTGNVSGQQWDAPFGWAPLQLVAVEGLRRYGRDAEADRIALAFLGTVLGQFVEHGAVFEKYDVVRRASDVAPGIRYGYASNQIGFGWTNGVFRSLEAGLGPAGRDAIVRAAAP